MVGFRSSRLAYAALLLMAMLWGSTLIVMKNAYAHMDPASLLSSRFIMAALAFGIVFPKAWKASWKTIRSGVVLGLLFGAGQILQALGLTGTTASVNGFITGLYVVITPLLAALFLGRKVTKPVWVAVGFATVGLGSLAIDPSALSTGLGTGELLTFLGAVAYASHIVATGKFATPNNVASLGLYQTLTIAVMTTLFAAPDGIILPSGISDWTAIAYLGIICGTVTVFLQSWAQTRVDATRSAVIMCTEPMWSAVFAVGIAGEVFTGQMILGAIAIMAAMFLVVRPAGRRRGTFAPTTSTIPSPAQPDIRAPRPSLDRLI
ncbi:hypothetical protein HMPREF1275_00254 [Propionibacterium sp. KPL1844]|mgnify:FL=1|nr:hypothetical protein HMPREF1275_00254 [Propionibacterium sp. KPL1844]